MNLNTWIIIIIIAIIVHLGFIHRHIFCDKENKEPCCNILCDYYGTSYCNRTDIHK